MHERALLTLGLLISCFNFLTGIPLAMKLIGINKYYGWRTDVTLHSSKLWYEINLKLGWGMLVAGMIGITLFALLEFDVIPIKASAKGILLLSIEGIATILVTLIVGFLANAK